jgi:sugar phosphate permease
MTTEAPVPDRLDERLLSLIWRKPAATIAERTRRRVTLHLVPYLFFLYILAYLDRVNVSVADLGMSNPPSKGGVGFDSGVIGFGAGIFFLSYWILEIPSTLSVARWGARWVFVRILILWGLCAAMVGLIGTPLAGSLFQWLPHVSEHGAVMDALDGFFDRFLAGVAGFVGIPPPFYPLSGIAKCLNGLSSDAKYQFYFFRFMLGFFEGGFFPSVIVYLSLWFRSEDRAKAIAGFMAAIPASGVLGMFLSGLVLDFHWLGLAGWRWVFILEGVAPILAGFLTLFFLPDRPATARWLPADERAWLTEELAREHRLKQERGRHGWRRHLGMVVLLTVVYLCLNVTSYGLSMFMPRIIKSQSGVSNLTATALASLFYLIALMAMLVNGWHSDRTGERPWHVAVPLFALSLGLGLTVVTSGWPILPVIVMLSCVATFQYSHLPAFWPMPTMFLGATAAAAATGFINMIGNLGGFVGPAMVGHLANEEGGFAPGLTRIAPLPLVAALIILGVSYLHRPRREEKLPPPSKEGANGVDG